MKLRQLDHRFKILIDKNVQSIVEPRNKAKLGQLRQYKRGFNYNGMPVIEALNHWTENRGLWLAGGNEYGAKVFAKWWLRCQGIDSHDVGQISEIHVDNFCTDITEMCRLHLALHPPREPRLYAKNSDYTNYTPERCRDNILWFRQVPDRLPGIVREYISNSGHDDDDWKLVRDHSDMLGVGRIYGTYGYLIQHEDRPNEWMGHRRGEWPHNILTTLNLDPTTVPGMQGGSRLPGLFDLPQLPAHGRFPYCTNNHWCQQAIAQTIAHNQQPHRLMRTAVIEELYIY